MAEKLLLTDEQRAFLCRFVDRGWLHGQRSDPNEMRAVEIGLRKRYLRRELREVHFTVIGRKALAKEPRP